MLPEAFLARMKPILGEQFDSFVKSLTEEEQVKALRLNPIKTGGRQSFEELLPFSPAPIPYAENGRYFSGDGIGRTALHHAGAVYVQDPGAMTALCAIDVQPDWKVCDLCAAPGGKSTQIAGFLGENGILFANEYVPSRARITVSNFERLGVSRAMVTNLGTAEYPRLFDSYFDLVVVDAPCSGEGMFRKNELALSEWSEDNIRMCAERQKEILDNAAKIVASDGYLLYSTCTFSPEEDELTVDAFLKNHPDYRLVKPKESILSYTAPGLFFDGMGDEPIENCRRFYPHVAPGEGQFVALFRRSADAPSPSLLYRDASLPLDKPTAVLWDAFKKENLLPFSGFVPRIVGKNLVLVPAWENGHFPVPPKSVFSAGILIGEVRGKLLFPSHQLFSALGSFFKRKVDLPFADERLFHYLRGEEIDTDSENGWCALLYNTIPLGGGKAVNGKIKNHYPKGLRLLG